MSIEKHGEQRMQCNVCGGETFLDMNGRLNVRCAKCGSLERARVLKMILDESGILKKGTRVLHFAPEGGLATYIKGIVGDECYDARDIDIERYQHVKVSYFDLVEACHTLPTNAFDLIIHNHVMEHLPCNVTAVLYHLHRALSDEGLHVFSIPDLPLNFHPAAIRAPAVFDTPFGAVGATGGNA
ncbi:class I SAM-dependent methyltransferase [Ensifer adhaerens]|nr:class I SAM-dependent methyltransferase [Ensifer adhaerens]UAY10984.1 class I SAM-dependent methyltransferase [Ensifer adhaerens]